MESDSFLRTRCPRGSSRLRKQSSSTPDIQGTLPYGRMTCKTDSPIQTLSQFASPGRFRLRLLFPRLFLLQRLLNDPDNRMSPRKILLFLQYPPRRSLQSAPPRTKDATIFLFLRGILTVAVSSAPPKLRARLRFTDPISLRSGLGCNGAFSLCVGVPGGSGNASDLRVFC
jgi:hypothetical protein